MFIRQSRSLELSKAGEKFLIETVDVLERVERLKHLFDEQPDNQVTILRIGYLPNFNFGRMYELLELFKTKHENVQYLMNPAPPVALTEGLAAGHYDLVFSLADYFQGNKDVMQTFFLENHLQIALPPQHPLNQKEKLYFSNLKRENFILLERQQSPLIVDYVIGQGLQNGFNLKANYYVKDLDEGLSMTALGKGLAFLYSGMNDGTLEEKYHIKIADLADISNDQNIICVRNKNNSDRVSSELYTFIKNSIS